ncbi:GNAT family N-acetyltransferase [Streptomyces xanthochromogenes]|uniref:GNAT family N-acetyltransferase n=1 Tax=Streptomyces xanthochromogenes TaxID=67384 RepID=UPI00381099ED
MSGVGGTEIRLADRADAAVIARIHMMSRVATMPYLPPQKRSHDQVTQWVEDVLLKSCRTWVAVRDGEILGYAALEGDMLEHLYLRPEVRRRGIGTLLLDQVRRHSPAGVSCTSSSRTPMPARSTSSTASRSSTPVVATGTWRGCPT